MANSRTKTTAAPINNIKRICKDLGDLFDQLETEKDADGDKPRESDFKKFNRESFLELKRKLAEFS